MADTNLLELANKAEKLANFYEVARIELKAIDSTIDLETGFFWLNHKGNTPDELRSNYNTWKDNILESIPKLDYLIRQCREKALFWRHEYERQQADELAAQIRQAQVNKQPNNDY